ncbi:Candidapepsin-1 [Dactylellina cionopaga]|nr:Candidapepsin-1 [Dactylellina cionopaga]
MRDDRAAAASATHVRLAALVVTILAFLSTNLVLATASPRLKPVPFQKYGHLSTIRKQQHESHVRRDAGIYDRGQYGSETHRLALRDDDLADDNIVHQLLQNKGILYLANVSVGTPPQPMQLQIDTASSDIWVLSNSVSACYNAADYDLWTSHCSYGSFDPSASETFKLVGQDRFSIIYADGTSAEGDYAEDTFTVGGATVTGMQIGVAMRANLSYGIMGVGFEADQASVSPGGMGQYQGMLSDMVSEGLIRSKAFSLWLDDLASDTGSLLFGGIDTARFVGNLTSIPIEKTATQVAPLAFAIPLTSVAFSDGKSHVNITSKYLPATVILDSGSSLTFLPHSIAWSIANQTGAKISHELGLFIIDCNYPTENSYVKYSFSYVMDIRVPMSELILPLTKYSGGIATEEDGSDICALGIVSSPGDINLFGDTFLRSAYVVYDLDNQRVAMAQTEFNPVGQEIVEIGQGKDSIPHVGIEAANIMATTIIDITFAKPTTATKSAATSVFPSDLWKYLILIFMSVLVQYNVWVHLG